MLIKFASRATLIALSAVALGGLAAACGSSSGNSSSATSSSTTGSASSATGSRTNRTALAACLRQHGVTLPAGGGAGGAPPAGSAGAGSGSPPAGSGSPPAGSGSPPAGSGSPPAGGFPGGGANSSKFRAALKACGANFPAGGRPGAGFSRQGIQKYVTCVRQHGYNLPNPNFSGKGSVFPANIRSNAKFQAASKACQSLLAPAGGAGGAGG